MDAGCALTLLIRGKKPKPHSQTEQVRKAGLAEKGQMKKTGKQQRRWPKETGEVCSARKGPLERHIPGSDAVEELRILSDWTLRDIHHHGGRK